MKTVGLITMHRVVNCGSQLQTYALYSLVSSFGYEAYVIDYLYPDVFHYKKKSDIGSLHSAKGVLKRLFHCFGLLTVAQRINLGWFQLTSSRKIRCGWKGLRLTKRYGMKSIKINPPVFDIYLVGSDQVWNPNCIVGDYTYLLDWAPESQPKVAYSSSFGVNRLPECNWPIYRNLLKRFNAIGIREPSGVSILDSLGIRNGVAVLDPVMLLTREQWVSYATTKRLHKQKYIFCYILSYVFKSNPWIVKYAKDVASTLDCEVVFYGGGEPDCMADANAAGFRVLKDYIVPQDLVRYYLDAEYIIANGFHGTAFAITLNKSYSIVTNPYPSEDDRVVSLLERTGCESRAVKCGVTNYNTDKDWLVDMAPERSRFDRLRAKSMEFLSCALTGRTYPGTFGAACD